MPRRSARRDRGHPDKDQKRRPHLTLRDDKAAKGRQHRPVSVSVSCINDEHGNTIGAASIARDITEQKHARETLARRHEEIKRSNERLADFTYLVSHDLRSPLRALSYYSTLLTEEYADGPNGSGSGYAERIASVSEQMSTFVENMLRLARIERANMYLQTVDLSAEVDAIASDLQREEPGRDVQFSIQRQVQVQADPASSTRSCRTW